MSSLVKQFGEPLNKDLSGGSPYFQKLRESPPLPARAVFLLEKFYGMKNTGSSIAPEKLNSLNETIAPIEILELAESSRAPKSSSAPTETILRSQLQLRVRSLLGNLKK
jgi:hypothetical protein